MPKKFAYRNTFDTYINEFLPSFSIDDLEKYDLYAHKNSKHLFNRFNDYILRHMVTRGENLNMQENWKIL